MVPVCASAVASARVVSQVLLRSSLSVVVAVANASSDSLIASLSSDRRSIAVAWAIGAVWTQVLMLSCAILITTLDLRRRYQYHTGQLPHLGRCYMRLMASLWFPVLLALLVTAAANFVVLMYFPLSWQRFRFGMYLIGTIGVIFVYVTARAERRIIRAEAARGILVQSPSTLKAINHRRTITMRFQLLLISASSFVVMIVAHILSTIDIQSQTEVIVTVIVSTFCKFLFQRLVRRFGPLRQRNAVLATVGPTILVETQVRMMLQRVKNVGNSVVVMAYTEVLFRVTSIIMLHWKLRRLRPMGLRRIVVMPMVSLPDHWDMEREQMLQFHAVTVHADMSSEYIAMACSYAIAYFWGSNAAFQFANAGGSSNTTLALTQFVIEMSIDWLCCTIECWFGIDFQQIQRNSIDVALTAVQMTVISIGVSCGLYAVIPQ